PKHLIWGIDLTGKTTLDGRTHLALTILEHASCAAIWLEALQRKSSWVLIRKLNQAIERYGKPKAARTDNEAIFTSRVFRFALFLLGVRLSSASSTTRCGRIRTWTDAPLRKPGRASIRSQQSPGANTGSRPGTGCSRAIT